MSLSRTFSTKLWERPRITFEGASAEQQQDLQRIFDRLEVDPYPDRVNKFDYTRLIPAMMYIYIDEDYEVIYQLTSHDPPNWEAWEIEVYAIALTGTAAFTEEPESP